MRDEGEKWSSSCCVPGKSKRDVWVVKASKVKYALCSKFLTCHQLFRAKRSLRCNHSWQVCHPGCPLWLEPASACAALLRRQEWCFLPVPLCSMFRAASGGHGASQGAATGSCAWALLKLFLPPLWQCCRWSHRTVLRNVIPEWKLLKKNQSLWQMPCLCCFESVVLLPVKLLQEASLQDEASLRFAKCQSPGLPALPAVSQCQPGAVHKDSRYYIVIWLLAFAEGATSMYRRQPSKFWYRRKYT